MRVEIQGVHYNNLLINKIYYGNNLVFDRSIYKPNENVYIFDLNKVAGNYTLYLRNTNSDTVTDWGDGAVDTYLSHTYAQQGIYKVKTRQRIVSTDLIYNNNTANSLINCINIDNTMTNCTNMFNNCINLTSISVIPNSVTNCSKMFNNCTSLINVPTIPNSVTNCYWMFYGCRSLTVAQTIPNGVINCNSMFKDCISLTTIPQSNINLMQAVTNGTNTICTSYNYCYYNCNNIISPQSYTALSEAYSPWF